MSKIKLNHEIHQALQFLGYKAEQYEELKQAHGGTALSLHAWLSTQL